MSKHYPANDQYSAAKSHHNFFKEITQQLQNKRFDRYFCTEISDEYHYLLPFQLVLDNEEDSGQAVHVFPSCSWEKLWERSLFHWLIFWIEAQIGQEHCFLDTFDMQL
jgi:hypothetical protein